MRKVLLILSLLLALSLSAQNRFEQKFIEADSAFFQCNEEVIFELIVNEMDNDSSLISLTVKECMYLYFCAFIRGAETKHIDSAYNLNELLFDLVRNKRLIKAHYERIYGNNYMPPAIDIMQRQAVNGHDK